MEVKTIKSNVGMSWKQVKIPDVLYFQEGPGVRNTQFTNSGVKLLNVGNINFGDLNLDATKVFISEKEAYNKYKHFLVEEGDLLIASSGILVDNFHNKITWAKKEHLPLCLNTSTIRFKTLDENVLDIKYFSYFLKTRLFADQLSRLITGSAQLNFGPSHLKQISLPLPPLTTQKRIAEILDAADALRRKDQELLKKYDELAQAIFIDMFGDPVKNEMGWEEIFLKNVCLKITDGTHQSPKFTDKGVPFLFVSNIVKNKISYETSTFISEEEFDALNRRTPIEVGNILITTVGSYGNPAVIENNSPFAFQRHIAFLKPNHSLINYYYLLGFLKSPAAKNQIDRKVNGVAQKTLNLSDLKDLKIWNVPRSLQDNYSEILNKLQLQLNLSETNRSNILFNSLIQKAFKGELV